MGVILRAQHMNLGLWNFPWWKEDLCGPGSAQFGEAGSAHQDETGDGGGLAGEVAECVLLLQGSAPSIYTSGLTAA